MTDKEVMQMALDALYENTTYSMQGDPVAYQDQRNDDTIEALRAALAQPDEYDQTALELCKNCGWKAIWPDGCLICEKQAALAQPKKEWVGLTDEEIKLMWEGTPKLVNCYGYAGVAKEIETKLKKKNNA